jgi:hypothetical protein
MPDLHRQRARPSYLGAGQRRLIDDQPLDRHRVLGELNHFHVQAKVTGDLQA